MAEAVTEFGADGESAAFGPGDPRPLFAAIANNLAAGVCVWDTDLRLVAWNAGYVKINSVAPKALRVGARLADILDDSAALHSDTRSGAEIEEMVRRRLSADGKLELDRVLADGRVISVNYHRIPGGGWLAIYRDATENRKAIHDLADRERELKLYKERLDISLDSMTHGFSIWDEDRRLVVWNRRYIEMYRMPPDKIRKGMGLDELCEVTLATGNYPGRTAEQIYLLYCQRFDETAEPGAVHSYERELHGRSINTTYTRTAGVGWVATHEDITAYKAQLSLAAEREAELKRQNMRFDAAINNMPLSLVMFDKDQRLVICNRNYQEIYKLPADLVRAGVPLGELIAHRRRSGSGTHPEGGDDYLARRMAVVNNRRPDVSTVELQNGRTVMIRHQPMEDGGWVATQEDITDRRRSEAQVSHLARHDPLTDLPNRSYFREQMDLAEARIRRGETMAVLCVDLDQFKGVNDTLGHSIGDILLQSVTGRLRACVREVDVVARLGGDEFAVLQGMLTVPQDAAILAGRIVNAIAEPFDIEGHHILIGASIGIAVAPADGRDAGTLMKNADLALYRAKGEGRGNYHFFEPGMDAAIQERRAIEVGLRLALSHNELRLVYQPLLSLTENRVTGLEALLRWDHPERGTVSPGDFVPVAEETGLIVPIGEWVLREACAAAAGWPEDVTVAVNLSPVQFKNRNLVHHVTGALSDSGLAPHRLEIEVTESLLLSDSDLTIKILHQLRKLGVRISMDDFGTGYSALSHLRSFPFDKIKIDRSFVQALSSEGDGTAIVKAMIGLGRSLGVATAAEGVETESQLELIRRQGCTEAQGFLFSPPLPAQAVSRLFAAASPRAALGPQRRSGS
jgi:diguanylate cyclase (GGDEF)-like protein